MYYGVIFYFKLTLPHSSYGRSTLVKAVDIDNKVDFSSNCKLSNMAEDETSDFIDDFSDEVKFLDAANT